MLRQYHNFHRRLTDLMQQLGYNVDAEGICNGISLMAMQAFLIDDIESFNDRIEFIASHPDLINALKALKVNDESGLSDDDKKLTDVLSLFDGVALYQKPEIYTDFFGSNHDQLDIQKISVYTSSNMLEDAGGFPKATMAWPGIYDVDELDSHFLELKNIADMHKQKILMLLRSSNHAIVIQYDPAHAVWLALDANKLPVKAITAITDISEFVSLSFNSLTNISAFETDLYLPGADRKLERIIASAVKRLLVSENLHVDYADSNNATLAYIAASHGHIQEIIAFKDAGGDLDRATESGMTPAHVAAQYGHSYILATIYNAGADLNKASSLGVTPAYVSAQHGHCDVILTLHQLGVDLEKKTNEGGTPAHIAAQNGHSKVIVALQHAGINLNLRMNDGSTPALIAANSNSLDVIRVLFQAGADLHTADNRGFTPAYFAVYWDNVAMLAVLEKAGVNFSKPTPKGTLLEVAKEKGSKKSAAFLENCMSRKSKKRSSDFFVPETRSSGDDVPDDLANKKPKKT